MRESIQIWFNSVMENNKRVQRVAGKAIIEAEGGILILKPSGIDVNKKWHVPGGIRDDIDEPLLSTAVREVLEETGTILESNSQKVLKIGEWPATDRGEKVKILGVFFHFTLTKRPEIQLSAEHDDFAWVNDQNIHEYDAHQDAIDAVNLIFSPQSNIHSN